MADGLFDIFSDGDPGFLYASRSYLWVGKCAFKIFES